MIGTFPLIKQNNHNYFNIITIDNISYNISFDDITLLDNTYLNCKSIIFTDSTIQNVNDSKLNNSYQINFIDILHYQDLSQNNIQELDIKNKIIKNFFYSTNTFGFLSIVLINKELLLDLFSLFKNINLIEYSNYENKNTLLKTYEQMLSYFISLSEQTEVIKNFNKINNDTSKINIPLILRIKLALQYKSILLYEYKLSLLTDLLNKVENINTKFLAELNENNKLIEK